MPPTAAPSPALPAPTMASLPEGYHALVLGASGALGAAFSAHLQADPRCAGVRGLHRGSDPPIDFNDEAGLARAVDTLRAGPAPSLVLIATGVLHLGGRLPEKRLADLAAEPFEAVLRANVVGPALCLRALSPLLDRRRALVGVLSAKVGSIGDNRLGGWYAYRASKAALNMVLKTAAIELRRSQPATVLAALHPGTVRSALSRPFRGDEIGRPPAEAAAELLQVLDGLQPEDSGCFVAYDGQRLPW